MLLNPKLFITNSTITIRLVLFDIIFNTALLHALGYAYHFPPLFIHTIAY